LRVVGSCDRFATLERPDRNALKGELRVLGEPLGERLPVAGAHAFVVNHHVVVEESDPVGHVEIFPYQRVERPIDPIAVAPVRLPTHTLEPEAGALRMPLRPLVEPVDLELEPVVAEILNEMALQVARRLVGHTLPAVVRMHCETLEVRDPRTAVLHLETHRARTSAVDLDHEAAVRGRIRLGSFDLGCNRLVVVRRPPAEKGLHVRVIHELDEEVDVVRTRPSDRDRHGQKRSRDPSCAPGTLRSLTQVAPEQPLHRALGLTDEELDRIRELLGREPNDFELAVFSLLWSEHCGYKHSALLLRRLPSEGERVLQGPGENAGVIDLGEGEAVAFKVESHNHPSAVEPFQGAATGVGGILRDIVAMGARPIALLDGLRFAEPDHHFSRAVAGIGHYGNSVGVATVGGEAVFDEAYRDNCLVNAMCIGLLPADRVTRARATAIGAHVVLYGATTGRDGIGGASVLASAELGEDDPDKRPTVQMGDPFTGKKLIEASLELVEGGLVESLQDCGAAGLASSLAEMARDGAGIDVHLDRVPLRETGMEPWEIMISESQERMVAVVRPQMLEAVQRVCATWELACTPIGDVSDTGELRAFFDDEVVGSIPAALLTDECPRYEVEKQPHSLEYVEPSEHNSSPKAWIYEQYDQLVGSRTVRRPGLDGAVLRLRPSLRGLAVSLQGPPPGERDPFRAGVLAVLGAARNVACAGGEPLALTDCLNFGNPEKPAIGWELEQAIEGIASAANALGIPVVSGNVSLYNDTDGRSIPPTPVVGCVGLVPDVRFLPGAWRSGDVVLVATAPGELDLAAEAALVRFVWKAAPVLTLAHDVSDGGLEEALREAEEYSGLAADVELPAPAKGGQIVLACAPDDVERLGAKGLERIGTVR
jgi:phosphoribosylformylglycinamidine synthase II